MKYKAVDLGLPSGLRWSNKNVGARSETDYGRYFQWGDVIGYTDGSHSSWETCPGNLGYSEYNEELMSKWNMENLLGKVLKPEVDAATVNMGSKWRIPTIEDFEELCSNTDQEYVEVDNMVGVKFISRTDSSKYIFIPFSGFASNESFGYQNIDGCIWTNTIYLDSPKTYACNIDFNEFGHEFIAGDRYTAMSIRGVR